MGIDKIFCKKPLSYDEDYKGVYKMGLYYFPVGIAGFPYELAEIFIKCGYTTLIETGTYTGDNALKASRYFDAVYTIEASKELYETAMCKFQQKNNIFCMHDVSVNALPDIHSKIGNIATIYWLDAHYSGGNTFLNDCPLAEEIKIINNKNVNDDIILVDDARLINSYYVDNRYLQLYDFIMLISNNNKRNVSLINDYYIATPKSLAATMIDYEQYISSFEYTFSRSLIIAY